MAGTFTDFKASLAGRGFDFLTDAQLGYYVNAAANEIITSDYWPWRKFSPTAMSTTTAGTNGLDRDGAVTGAAVDCLIESVQLLEGGLYRTLDFVPWADYLTATGSKSGTPLYWTVQYQTSYGAAGIVAIWPASGGESVRINSYNVSVTMAAGGDSPNIPPTAWNLLVDIAVRMAYRDTDNHQSAEALQVQIARDLDRLRLNSVEHPNGVNGYVERTMDW